MTENAPIKIMIADEHPIVREGLKKIISETTDMQIVADVGTGLEAIKQSRILDFQFCYLKFHFQIKTDSKF